MELEKGDRSFRQPSGYVQADLSRRIRSLWYQGTSEMRLFLAFFVERSVISYELFSWTMSIERRTK